MSLIPDSSLVNIGSSVNLTCGLSLENATKYNGFNITFEYYDNKGSAFRVVTMIVGEGMITTATAMVIANTSSAGTYTCNVTISDMNGSIAAGQDTNNITVLSKNHIVVYNDYTKMPKFCFIIKNLKILNVCNKHVIILIVISSLLQFQIQ